MRGVMLVIRLHWSSVFRAGTDVLPSFSEGGKSLLSALEGIQEMPWQIFRWFDGFVLTIVAISAYSVVWPCLRIDMMDESFHGVLFFFRVS